MSDNITKFYCKDAAKEPDAVLEQAVGVYDDGLILGWDKEGNFDPRANLNLKANEMLWMIEQFKKDLLDGVYSE